MIVPEAKLPLLTYDCEIFDSLTPPLASEISSRLLLDAGCDSDLMLVIARVFIFSVPVALIAPQLKGQQVSEFNPHDIVPLDWTLVAVNAPVPMLLADSEPLDVIDEQLTAPPLIALVPADIAPVDVTPAADNVPLDVSDEQLTAPPLIAFVPAENAPSHVTGLP